MSMTSEQGTKTILCPHCGEFFFTESKFPVCRKCHYEDVIELADELVTIYESFHAEEQEIYEEQLREQFVYNNPNFSKVAYNETLQKAIEIEKETNEQYREEQKTHPTCPKCYSCDTTVSQNGFSLGKAVAGTLLVGGSIGTLAGFAGSGKAQAKCTHCGHRWTIQ